jgi:serine/threonine-protein kinase RsbW
MTGQTEPASRTVLAAHPRDLRWERDFPGEKAQLAGVRRWIGELLPRCDAREVVALVASELSTNAIRHTASGRPGGRFGVTVTWTAESVLIEVDDAGGPSVPKVIEDADGENGRGLQLVLNLSSSLSVYGDEEGRLMRADIPWAAEGGPVPRASGYGPEAIAALAGLKNAHPMAVIWFGQATLHWWALVPTRHGDLLLEGLSPGDLMAALDRLRPAALSRHDLRELTRTRPQAIPHTAMAPP